jgi:hypothetical protein
MASKNNPQNWNDVQTAIAAVAVVTTLGLWNLFAAPDLKKSAQVQPLTPEPLIAPETSSMPQVKIFFTTQTAPQSTAPQSQETVNRKNKNSGGGTVTKTKTS